MSYKKLNFSSVVLSVTDECNLRCKYCFVNHQPHYMELDVAKKVIDIFKESSYENKTLTFFGGEPMLMWDKIIVPTVLYSEQINANVNFNITTNGTLINEDRLKFMKDHNISLLFSFDGSPLTQDYNRPTRENHGSFKLIEEAINLIPDYFPETTVRGTIIPQTCKNLSLDMLFIINNRFKNFFFIPDNFSNWEQKDIDVLHSELRKYTLYFIQSYIKNETPANFIPFINSMRKIPLFLDNKKNGVYEKRNCKQCGLGYEGSVCINYKGDIFGCQELSSSENNLYLIGDIYNGIDTDKQFNLIKQFKEDSTICEIEEFCSDCQIKEICENNICHANYYLKNKNFSQKPFIQCVFDRIIFYEACIAFNILYTNKNEKFMEDYSIK